MAALSLFKFLVTEDNGFMLKVKEGDREVELLYGGIMCVVAAETPEQAKALARRHYETAWPEMEPEHPERMSHWLNHVEPTRLPGYVLDCEPYVLGAVI